MKRIALASVLSTFALVAIPAHAAGTAAENFNVNLTLTPVCVMSTVPALAISYTAFAAAADGSTTFTVTCSTGLIFALDLDAPAAGLITDGVTGLQYRLALTSNNADTATAPIAALSSLAGSSSGTSYYVKGQVLGNQAGTTSAGTPNNARTVTVSY